MQVVPPVPDELDRLDRVLREMGVDPDAEWDFLNDNTDVPGRFQSEDGDARGCALQSY